MLRNMQQQQKHGEKVAAAKRAADELERKAKEAAQKAEAGAKAAADLEEMWKKAAGGGEEACEEEPAERTKEQEDKAMHEMLRGLSNARARAEKRLKKELRSKLKRAKTTSIGERKRLQSEIEQLRSKIKRIEAEQAMEDIRKEKERKEEKAKETQERDETADEPAGDIPPEEPASPQVPSPKVKEEGLKKEEEERRQEKADMMLEKERERGERLRRLMMQTHAFDLTGEVVEEEEPEVDEEEEGDTYDANWYGAMVRLHAQYARLRETTMMSARHTPHEDVANKNSVTAATRDANDARRRAVWAALYLSEAEESEKEEATARAAAAEEAAEAEEKVLFDLLDRIANEAALDADAAQEKTRKEERAAAQLRREEGERAASQLGVALCYNVSVLIARALL
jgi:hypothetical protein